MSDTLSFTADIRWLDEQRGILVWSFDPKTEIHFTTPPGVSREQAVAEIQRYGQGVAGRAVKALQPMWVGL